MVNDADGWSEGGEARSLLLVLLKDAGLICQPRASLQTSRTLMMHAVLGGLQFLEPHAHIIYSSEVKQYIFLRLTYTPTTYHFAGSLQIWLRIRSDGTTPTFRPINNFPSNATPSTAG